MRIGMMADLYKPHVSGVTNHIALNKKFMEAEGHEVFVFTFGDKDHPDDEPNVVRSAGLPVGRPLITTDVQLNIRYGRPARELLRSMDLVHVHHPFLSGTLAMRYCRPFKIPIVFTNHTRYDLYYQAYMPMLPEALGDTFLHTFLPTFCRACDLVIAPSLGVKTVLQGFGVNTPVAVIPNGVDLEPIRKVTEPVERSRFGFREDDVVLLYVGRLGPEKNLPFLLRCFGGVSEAYDNVRLLIAGKGPEQENLEDRVQHMGLSEAIRFLGLVDYEELPKYLRMVNAFVTASVTEVHPLTVIEAMAAGLPVLGIDSPGVGDTVVDGKTGFISSNDLAAFTAKMVRLVTQAELRKEMGGNAKRVAEDYAIQRTVGILLEQYVEIVKQAAEKRKGLRESLRQFFARLRT